MPVSFLSTTQRERYGRYPADALSGEELARYFHLDDDDREWIATKRRDSHRLGYALQLTTVRFLGTFLEDPTAVPGPVLHALSSQLGIADPTCVLTYRESEQRWRHTTEIRARYGYCEFTDRGVQFPLGRWLCALCWTGTDRPSALFDYANGWLVGHKVLLPGVTVLERFVAELKKAAEENGSLFFSSIQMLAGEDDEKIWVMLGAFNEEMGTAPDRVTETDEKLQQ